MKINKTRVKYVISEITIVSVGILIAFFINNWSSNIKKNNTFQEHKSGLVIDLEKNIENLERIIKVQQTKVESLNNVLPAIPFDNNRQLEFDLLYQFNPKLSHIFLLKRMISSFLPARNIKFRFTFYFDFSVEILAKARPVVHSL